MIKVKLLVVGKIKEISLKHLIEEYLKRLKSYCQLEIIESMDEKAPEKLSLSQQEDIKNEEGKKILNSIQVNDFVITLEIAGKMISSEDLSHKIDKLQVEGISSIVFVIGGSLGLSEKISQRSNMSLSLSKMTFPHQIARLLILEQLYRAFKIMHNEPYHK